MNSLYPVNIIDSTLREGMQTPGININFQQKLGVVGSLSDLGVQEIELGIASICAADLPSLVGRARQLIRQDCALSLWSRCKKDDIEYAGQCDPDIISLSIPVSDLHIHEKFGLDREKVLDILVQSISHARHIGLKKVSVGCEDATRADRDYLLKVITAAERAGAFRVRLADTVGIATPGIMSDLVRLVKSHCSLPVGVHAHNDFGMATANTMAAIEAGASWADATILGLGERSGNCRLEELIGYLSLAAGDGRYQPGKLSQLCKFVADVTNLSISARHPVIGEEIFTCETGLHVYGLMKKPETYEPFDPHLVGKNRVIRFGAKTGKKAVLSTLSAMGVHISEREAAYLVAKIKKMAGDRHESMDSTELCLFARRQGIGQPVLNAT